MLRVGVTASIGAGKTTVCKILKDLGCYYTNTDEVARLILTTNPVVIKAATKLLGNEAYTEGELDRQYVSKIVFNDEIKRKALEKILEPKMRDYVNHMANTLKDKKILIVESAIFFETNTEDLVDLMVGVDVPEAIRIERVQKRNNLTYDQVMERMKAQLDNAYKMKQCDFIIDNSGDVEELFPRVEKLYKLLSKIGNL